MSSLFLDVPRTMGKDSPPARRGRVIGWHYDYLVRVGSIAAHTKGPLVDLAIMPGAPFCLRGIGGYNVVPAGAGPPVVSRLNDCLLTWADSSDNFLQNQPIGMGPGGLMGANVGGDWPTGGINALYEPVYNQVVFAPNSVLQFQVTNNSLATLGDVRIVFRGTKLFYDERIYCPSYPSRYTSQPFQYPVQFPFSSTALSTITVPASTILRSIQVPAQGTDFVLRGGVMEVITGSIADVEIKLMDQSERPYSNDFIHWNWLFSNQFAQRPGIWYPEIYLPKNRMVLMDIQQVEAAEGVFSLVFEGSRVFPR